MKREPIYGIDFIRFAAALMVLLYHFGFKAYATAGDELLVQAGHVPTVPAWYMGTWWGWIGVQIFFVISGLVISYSTNDVTVRRFVEKRILRLVPTAWICGTIALIVCLLVFDWPASRAALPYLRLMVFAPSGPWILGQFWTLPIECCFYAMVALLIWIRKGRDLEPLAWWLTIASLLYFTATHWFGFKISHGRLTALLLLQHGQFFALGIVITRGDLHGWRFRHLLLMVVIAILAAVQIRDAAIGEKLGSVLAESWRLPFLVWLSGMAAIVASLHWKERIAIVCRPHRNAVTLLGALTYPLYLIHIHAGGPLFILLSRWSVPPAIVLAATVATSIVVAVIIVKAMEPPLRHTLEKGLAKIAIRRRHAA